MEWTMLQSDQFVIIKDIKPVATHHFLVSFMITNW